MGEADFEQRFWPKVLKTDSCWIWTAHTNACGYGRIWYGKAIETHRASWEMHFGAIPEGLCVLHKCDNPPCVNPDHLWLGTHADNMKDCARKRRIRSPGLCGENNPGSRLTRPEVREMRRLYAMKYTMAELSGYFAVSVSTVSRIINNHLWTGE
jgi:HNH endonuclease